MRCVVKERFVKKYRVPALDEKLTKTRLLQEAKSINTGSKDPTQATVEKTAIEQSSEKKADENKAAPKPPQNDPKQTNKDKNPVKPAGK